jgi:hypothetical protein
MAPQAQRAVLSSSMAGEFNTHRPPLEIHQACVQYEHQRNECKPELLISDGVTDAFNIHRLPLEKSQGPADAFNTHRLPLGNTQGPADAFNTHSLPLGNHQDIVGIGETSPGARPSCYNQDNLRIPSRTCARMRSQSGRNAHIPAGVITHTSLCRLRVGHRRTQPKWR